MDKKIAGLLGAVAALASLGTVQAEAAQPSDALKAGSYADLLKPIPNAMTVLTALDESSTATQATFQVAENAHHHHHHHHSFRRERRIIVAPRRHHHHHHHHDHH